MTITCPECERQREVDKKTRVMCDCGTYLFVDAKGEVRVLPDNPAPLAIEEI